MLRLGLAAGGAVAGGSALSLLDGGGLVGAGLELHLVVQDHDVGAVLREAVVMVVADLDTVELDDLPVGGDLLAVDDGVLGQVDLDLVVAFLLGAEGLVGVDHPLAVADLAGGQLDAGQLLDLGLVAALVVLVPGVDEDGGAGGQLTEGRVVGLGAGGRGEREGGDAEDGDGEADGTCGTSHDEPHFLLEGN